MNVCVWKHTLSRRHIFDAQSLVLLCSSSVSITHGLCYSSSCGRSNNNEQLEESSAKKPRGSLTRELVDLTLANCPSDLIALNFFLWCARQPNYFHDYGTIDRMVGVVGRLSERFISVNGIIRELSSVGCMVKPQTFLMFLRVCWRGGMYGMVFDALDEMVKLGFELNEFARFVVMDVLFKTGNVNAALNVLDEMPFPMFFYLALSNLCGLKDFVGLKMVMRVMLGKRFYPKEKTLVMVLDCLCKEQRMAEAFQVVGLMAALGFQVSLDVWSILIDGFCRVGRYVEAGWLLEKMIDMGFSPDIRTFTFLVKGFLESRMIDRAFRTFDLMAYCRCEVDVVFFNVLVHCLSKIGWYDEALGVLFEMRKKNLEPDQFTFSSVASTLPTPRKSPLLTELLAGSSIQPDVVFCNALLSYFCRAGSPREALKLYDFMLFGGFTPDKYTYAGSLTALCHDNKIREAVTFYRQVRSSSHADAHVNTVILGELVKAEKHDIAISLFREALAANYPLDVVSFTIAISALVRSNRVGDAHTLYNQMKELAISPNRHTCSTLILGLCRERHLNLVNQILVEMLDTRIKLNFRTCMKIGDLMFKSRSCQETFALVVEMWDSGLVPDKALLILLVEGFDRGIQVDKIYNLSLKGDLGDDSFVEISSSDDQPVMMVLVG